MADIIKIQGAKAGMGGAKQPSIAKDTAQSISYAKILYGLSEGEIYGLANGAKSIMLDDTPLLDDNGNPNFKDDKGNLAVTWDMRNGTNDQEYIKGFPAVENESAIGVELKSSNDFVKTISNAQLSAIRLRLSWAALREQDSKGNVKGITIKYAVDVATDGGAYQTVLDTKVADKTSGKYERSHRIDLPRGKTWTIRVRRITPNATGELISDKMYVDAITEIIDVKLRYPNTAMLGLQYDASTFSNIAKLAARCKGKIIAVPTNYDPVARTYNGIWDGTFKQAYANNPAWVFYDICTQWRYGLGDRLNKTMVDKWSLYLLAQYCDQPVSDGKGGTEPRFTINVYLQSQQEAFSVLQSLSSIFRAMSYWQGEQIVLDADLPKDPVYTFSRANVVEGAFSYTGTRARDRHTVAKVAWDNPEQRFKTEYEWVRDEQAIARYGIKVVDISMMGCTSQGQAQRAGLWALKSEQLETRTVSFKTGLEGFIPTVGSIINVSDEVLAGRANGGRVSAVSSDSRIITLDRDCVINVGDTLIINADDGKAQRRIVSGVSSRNITVSVAFDSVTAENVWVVDSSDLKTMRFRVLSITQDDNTFAITALQHEPQKYDAIDYGAIVEPTAITINTPLTIDSPKNVILSQRNRIEQGQNITTLVISWEQVSGAVAYDVEWRKDEGNWIRLPRTGNNSIEIEGIYSGDYLVKVKAVSAFDVISAPTTSMLTTIVGKIGKPPVLASLKATGLLFGMQLDWLFAQGSGDTAYTEIQVGTAPDTNVSLLGQYAYPTNTATIQGLQGNLTQYYRGRLIDKLGNVGDWSAWAKGVTDASADKVLDLLNGKITESQLYKDLGAKIAKISTNELAISKEISDRQAALTKEIADRQTAINTINTDIGNQAAVTTATINQEIAERKAAINDVNAGLSSEVQSRLNADNSISASVTTETTNRTNADNALSSRIDTVTATSNDNKALIVSEQTTRANADSALSSRIDTVVAKSENNTALISTEQKTRADADSALSTKIDTNKSTTDNKIALAQDSINTVTTAQSATATKFDGVYAQLNPRMAGDDTKPAGSDEGFAGVWSEMSARIEGDSALSVKIDNVTANFNNNLAYVSTTTKATADGLSSLASQVTVLSSAVGGNISLVMDNYYTKTTTDQVVANKLEALKADFVMPELNKKATTGAVTDVKSQIDNVANQLNIASSKLDGVYAQITPRMAGDEGNMAGDGSIYAGVWTETSARIENDSALGLRIDALNVSMNDNTASINTLNKVMVNADSALSSRLDNLNTDYQGNKASVNNQLFTLSNATSSQASSISGLQASVSTAQTTANTAVNKADNAQSSANNAQATANDAQSKSVTNTANILSEQKARADADGALSSRIDTAQSTANNAHAALNTEQQTRASQDNALSSRIDTVQSSVGQNTASIQTTQQSINGLYAQYTVKLDVNGRVSGFGTANDGNVSDFAVRADKFYIAPPEGNGKGDSPFMVLTTPQTINGTTIPAGTYLQSAYIANGSIDNAQIKDGAITNAKIGDAQITSAKIGVAQVDTLQIAGEAVIVPRVQFTPTRFDFYSIDTEEVVNSITIDPKGGAVSISFGFESLYANVNSKGQNPRVILRIKRNGTILRTLNYDAILHYLTNENGTYYSSGECIANNITLPTMLDIPTGVATYEVTLESVGLNAGKSANDKASSPVQITARSLHIMGAKR